MRRPRRLLLLVVAPRRARADRRAIIIVDGPARVGMVVFLLVRSDRRDIPPGRRATDGRGGRDLGLPEGGGGGAPGVNPGGGESGGGGGAGAGACVRYGATLAGQPELKDMFPSSRMLQFCSVLAIAFYLVAFLAVVVVFFASVISSSSAHRPGAIDRSYEESAICPPTTTTTGAGMTIAAATAVAAFSFPTSAIMHIVILHGLLHYNDHDGEANNNDQSSPICNPTYSSCYLGPGGRYAVLAIVTAFFCGIVSLLPAYYYVGCNKAGRNARLCCWR